MAITYALAAVAVVRLGLKLFPYKCQAVGMAMMVVSGCALLDLHGFNLTAKGDETKADQQQKDAVADPAPVNVVPEKPSHVKPPVTELYLETTCPKCGRTKLTRMK